MLTDRPLTIGTLLRVFSRRIVLTWLMTLAETTLMALIPLFIGFAIDDLVEGRMENFWQLAGIMAALIVFAVIRRIYDTRAYGSVRVALGKEQAVRSSSLPVSALNARLSMGRELVDFLEQNLPDAMTAAVQLTVSVIVLYAFAPMLAVAAGAAAVAMVLIYALFHGRFFRLNSALNRQSEKQVSVFEQRKSRPIHVHLMRLRQHEIRLSDTEAVLYGLIFVVLLGLILFNLWFAASRLDMTVGTIFSIISYSWEFVESALALPVTLQTWSRLSEIMRRLNSVQVQAGPG
ncbi:hypothetical protein E1180_19010 [Roseibium denhamense]|uniref:ABC transporter transmembrane region n=1 Tax=Roseibium denhamense TaxID=76305 RepID=A0ABY1P1I6_9HYPH|nr:ABC transporter six-transmembrane domain-containing protein [Roseibium denhamense]MTI07595.1 hypothetical protein [Roseibium denhamense]SMP24027.1 ABC transporter transmembrane region [Roseibium denhamense]